jgi:hypothetical protein
MTTRIPSASTAVTGFCATPAHTKPSLPTAAELAELMRGLPANERHGIMAGGCVPRPRPDGWCGTGGLPSFPPHHGGGCWNPLDLGALKETQKLDHTFGPISAEQLTQAIENGTADLDGQAAGGEYRAFANWAQQNGARLSPEARQVMDIYSKYAAQAQARGQSGIPQGEYNKMLAEMKNVSCGCSGDQSAKSAVAQLDRMPSPISGDDFARIIRQGVGDRDGNLGVEAKAIREWVGKNYHKLSDEACQVMEKFNGAVDKATWSGQKDIAPGDWKKLLSDFREINSGDLSAPKATEKLTKENGPISGEDMLAAIKEGISDKDGKSTTSELREFQKWARENPHRLTPEARQVLQTYEKHARKAGPEGMTQRELDSMFKEMGKFKTFRDNTMRDALEKLDDKAGKISGKDLANAIKTGAGDFDGQAAGAEFADMMKWARQNRDRLTPEARQVLDIYSKYATRNAAHGNKGIPNDQFQRMLKEMDRVGQPVFRPVFFQG